MIGSFWYVTWRSFKNRMLQRMRRLRSPRYAISFAAGLAYMWFFIFRRMKESITRRAKSGAAVILSSHLLHLVEELCHSIAIIQNGMRVAYGTIDDLKWQIAQGRGSVSLEEAFLKITETPAGARSAT